MLEFSLLGPLVRFGLGSKASGSTVCGTDLGIDVWVAVKDVKVSYQYKETFNAEPVS